MNMDASSLFANERELQIQRYREDLGFSQLSHEWLEASMKRRYVYNFDWLGRPIIQYPQDIVAVQEIVWRTKPDLIVETGIAHGGSVALSASMLALLDLEDYQAGGASGSFVPKRKVIGIDIDIRDHNRAALENHPYFGWMELLEGSSIDPVIVREVHERSSEFPRIMVMLDSMHTHNHVLAELESYGSLVSVGNYLVVFDTFVEDMPQQFFADRPWDVGNNPKTAVREWLSLHPDFTIDPDQDARLQISVAPSGYIVRQWEEELASS